MPKKSPSTKRKKGKTKAGRKRAAGTIPWRNISIVLSIILCGIIYILIRYDALKLPKDSPRDVYQKRELTVKLYYADPNSDKLTAEPRTIQKNKSLKKTIATTIEELIEGPQGNLINTIPSNTLLEEVRIDSDGVVWADFSSHLSAAHPGGSSAEIMTVYAIVNTILLNFSKVKKVGILIEGKSVDTLAGHLDCGEPFVADRSLIQ